MTCGSCNAQYLSIIMVMVQQALGPAYLRRLIVYNFSLELQHEGGEQ